MSKYAPLGDFLRQQRGDEVPMTFSQIEKVTGTKLPASARYRAWWSNNTFNSVMTKVWLDAGFKSEQVDLEGRKLVFRRMRDAPPIAAPAGDHHPLFGALKGLMRIAPRTDLTEPADPDWGRE
jgi:hypothetical protein